MSACISAEEYVIWVKGSLNRWLGANLHYNGSTAPPYHGWVKEFQTSFAVCTRNGTVDEATQDAMIKANHQDASYVMWVQQSLNQAAVGVSLAAGATMTSETTAAIKKFQKSNKLKDNGWVGAKTETALRKSGAGKPPVHRRPFINTNHRQDWKRLGALLSRVWLGLWYEGLVNITAEREWLGDDEERFMCFLTTLLSGGDDEYVSDEDAKFYIYTYEYKTLKECVDKFEGNESKEGKLSKVPKHAWDTLGEYAEDVRMTMFDYKEAYWAFKEKVVVLYENIENALKHIGNKYNLSSHENYALDYIMAWSGSKQEQEYPPSILGCFQD